MSWTSWYRFGVPASRHVGVGQFIDQRDLGFAGQEGIHVHLFDGDAVILLATPGNRLEPLCEFGDVQRGRVFRAVR